MKTPKQEFKQITKAFELIIFIILIPFIFIGFHLWEKKLTVFFLILLGGLLGGLAFVYWL